jgi:parallel beta-helix repeat protein
MLSFKQFCTAIGILGTAVLTGMCQTVLGANLCVNPSGAGGCFTTIGAAVSAASPGDTIQVGRGTYNEDVTIGIPLSLIGQNQENTIIDAGGLSSPSINGITITYASNVVISGFTVENAMAAGIKVLGSTAAPASHIVISNNTVKDNDTAGEGNCASVEPLEPLDCGEGMFLSGVDHSVVANNTITGNAGGILVTDDTGPNHDNLITGNSILRIRV